MNFEPVCDKPWWILCGIALTAVILCLLYRKDQEFGRCESDKIKIDFLLFCNAGVLLLMEKGKEPWYAQGCFMGMFVYLAVAGVMDCRLKMISDFLHGIGLLSAGILAFCSHSEPEVWWSFLMFCLVQYLVFRHMYGPADVIIFLICALFLAAQGRKMEVYLIHMALTFVLLGVIQLLRRNISERGNLKEPVALVPYIAVSFFMII